VKAQRSIRTLAAAAIARNKALLSNATSIVGTVGIQSVLGFVYWALAAKLFSPPEVGLGSAATSAMTLLGTVGMFGLGPMLIGELPRRRVRGPLVSASLIATGVGSLVLGVAFAVTAPRFGTGFDFATGSLMAMALFLFGVVITGVTKTFDQACIGILKGGIQLTRNLVLAIVKVATLPLGAYLIHDVFGVGIMLTWVVGMLISLGWVAIQLSRSGVSVTPKPDWDSLRALGRVTLAHNWLNLAIFVPPALMPVVVTGVVSPTANAAFYVAWMIASFMYIIPASLSTVLFAVASADATAMAAKLRFTMRVSMYLGVPGMLAVFLGGHFILEVFGKSYAADGTIPLWLFAACYLPTVPVSFYIAVCRTTNKVPLAAAVLTTSSVIQIAAAAAGGVVGGLLGLSIALVAVKFIEGFVTLPAVLKAMRYRPNEGQARADRWTGGARDVPSRHAVEDARPAWGAPAWGAVDYLTGRQRAGIAALIAISMASHSTGPLPVLPGYLQRDVSRRESAAQQHRQPQAPDRHRAGANRFTDDRNGYPRQSDGHPWPQPDGYPRPRSNGHPQQQNGYPRPQSDDHRQPRQNGYPQPRPGGYPYGDPPPQPNRYRGQANGYRHQREQRPVPEYSHEDDYWSRS
jgi:O-antigen/teichoic acid export membrane protein